MGLARKAESSGTRLPHWVKFSCEKFNPVTKGVGEEIFPIGF